MGSGSFLAAMVYSTEPDHFTKWSGEGSPLDAAVAKALALEFLQRKNSKAEK
jgi:hypothetical protein